MKLFKSVAPDTRMPIAATLRSGQLLAAAAALVIAGAVLVAYQLLEIRQALTDGARVQAAIVADSVTAPLMFGDRDVAQETLRAFRYAQGLKAVGIYDRDGRRFAEFSYPDSRLPLTLDAARGERDGGIVVADTVRYRGEVVGHTVLHVGTERLHAAMLRYVGLLGVASLGAMLVVATFGRTTRARVAAAERKLDYMAHTDHVTQLPNRHATYGRLEAALDEAAAAGMPCDLQVLRAGAARPATAASGTLAIVDEPVSGYAGAVALVEEDQHLRFDIDTKEAARAGLRFSARLLRLARNVR
jgi:hypothetical protein